MNKLKCLLRYMTKKELTSLLNVNKSTINRWLTGVRKPNEKNQKIIDNLIKRHCVHSDIKTYNAKKSIDELKNNLSDRYKIIDEYYKKYSPAEESKSFNRFFLIPLSLFVIGLILFVAGVK